MRIDRDVGGVVACRAIDEDGARIPGNADAGGVIAPLEPFESQNRAKGGPAAGLVLLFFGKAKQSMEEGFHDRGSLGRRVLKCGAPERLNNADRPGASRGLTVDGF